MPHADYLLRHTMLRDAASLLLLFSQRFRFRAASPALSPLRHVTRYTLSCRLPHDDYFRALIAAMLTPPLRAAAAAIFVISLIRYAISIAP